MKRKNLWVEANQGVQKDGRAYGFVGTSDVDEYQGWFFVWPGREAQIRTVAERESVIESLEADDTCSAHAQIPYAWARQKLDRYLREKFDLRRKS